MIKLSATGLYTKAIERWNAKDPANQSAWTQFRPFIIAQYKRMLAETGGHAMPTSLPHPVSPRDSWSVLGLDHLYVAY